MTSLERIQVKEKTEVLIIFLVLCGIYRLHSVNVLGDAGWVEVFGMVQSVASYACNLFFEFMWKWWSYLLFDHMSFWVARIPAMAEAIRLKMSELGCHFEPGTFNFLALSITLSLEKK